MYDFADNRNSSNWNSQGFVNKKVIKFPGRTLPRGQEKPAGGSSILSLVQKTIGAVGGPEATSISFLAILRDAGGFFLILAFFVAAWLLVASVSDIYEFGPLP